jgi:hypothetical protein
LEGELKMKKKLIIALLVTVLSAPVFRASAAPDEYDDSQSDPLRILAYAIYPAAYLAEWVVFRPFHYIVSRRGLDKVFGHTPHDEIKPAEQAPKKAPSGRT